ncbi:hypothetical protein DL770_000937 [Monosporascus sp. CRB-9-2]|nr:hypothetical protein DL770_000937 [Monosporascus sp. CRB-9-2]
MPSDPSRDSRSKVAGLTSLARGMAPDLHASRPEPRCTCSRSLQALILVEGECPGYRAAPGDPVTLWASESDVGDADLTYLDGEVDEVRERLNS